MPPRSKLQDDVNVYLRSIFFWLGFMSHQHCKGYLVTFQLYCWMKTSGASPCIISGVSTGVELPTFCKASWLASLHKRIQSPLGRI